MATRTAIIDLGSNGIRMAIYEKTSRFAFFILNEQKVKFRLAHGMDENLALSNKQMQKAVQILEYFYTQAKNYKCKKIKCIGTSAIRSASNKVDFLKLIKDKIKLNIKIISGEEEAYLSGFGAINLLPTIQNALALDIGGGSAELCLIAKNKIVKTFSLDIGTVRLKDIYKDKFTKLENYVDYVLSTLPDEFNSPVLIAIGGSLRAISNAIMEKNNYCLNQVHSFSYKLNNEINFIQKIINANNNDLSSLGIKKERHDTIKIGALVFLKIAKKINAKQIITSGAGVREGVFLKDLFARHKGFATNFNPSLKSIQDRFLRNSKSVLANNCSKLFEHLKEINYLDEKYKKLLIYAAKIDEAGNRLSYYSKHKHSAYFALSALNFCIWHEEKAIISTILELKGKKFNFNNLKLKELLSDESTIAWLNYILALAKILSINNEKCNFFYKQKTLHIQKNTNNFIIIDAIKKLSKPKSFGICFNEEII